MERGAETVRTPWRTAAPDCAPEGTAGAPGETVLSKNLCSESIEFAPGIDWPPDWKVVPPAGGPGSAPAEDPGIAPAGGPGGSPAGIHLENASLNSLQNLVLETKEFIFLDRKRELKIICHREAINQTLNLGMH